MDNAGESTHFKPYFYVIREWSLITGRGGYKTGGGGGRGACEVLHLRKGGV